ncbi:MAG: hypothetical protein ACI8WT_000018 [Clostridium sp.]|jgi:hypothetical protein
MVNEKLARSEARLAVYYDAELAVLSGQAYTIGTRSLTRANLGLIRDQIDVLENKVDELKAQLQGNGLRKAYRITPRDI